LIEKETSANNHIISSDGFNKNEFISVIEELKSMIRTSKVQVHEQISGIQNQLAHFNSVAGSFINKNDLKLEQQSTIVNRDYLKTVLKSYVSQSELKVFESE